VIGPGLITGYLEPGAPLRSTQECPPVFGSASLLPLLAGYGLGAEMQGFPSSTTTVVFWGAAALLAGPLLGLSACLDQDQARSAGSDRSRCCERCAHR
jgi:Family of unknown function (DUF6518)